MRAKHPASCDPLPNMCTAISTQPMVDGLKQFSGRLKFCRNFPRPQDAVLSRKTCRCQGAPWRRLRAFSCKGSTIEAEKDVTGARLVKAKLVGGSERLWGFWSDFGVAKPFKLRTPVIILDLAGDFLIVGPCEMVGQNFFGLIFFPRWPGGVASFCRFLGQGFQSKHAKWNRLGSVLGSNILSPLNLSGGW